MDAPQEASGSAPAPACPANKGQAVNFIQEVQAGLIHSRSALAHISPIKTNDGPLYSRQTRFQESQRPELYQRFLQAFTERLASTTGSGGASSGLAGKTAEDVARPVHEKMRDFQGRSGSAGEIRVLPTGT
jgi:hypothetical protein